MLRVVSLSNHGSRFTSLHLAGMTDCDTASYAGVTIFLDFLLQKEHLLILTGAQWVKEYCGPMGWDVVMFCLLASPFLSMKKEG
jgi:hypothetical protein